MISRDPTPPGAVLARLVWMMLGPLLLAVCGFLIVKRGNGWLTPPDIAFLGVLAAMMLARWLEFRGGHAQTAEGEPATAADLRRYLVLAPLVGVVGWAIANYLGNHVLNL